MTGDMADTFNASTHPSTMSLEALYNLSDLTTEDPAAAGPMQQVMHLPALIGLFVTLYAVIFLLGLSGNVLVVYIVLRKKTMQTITNIFITNLAISDILMCLLAVPFTPLSYFMQSWLFGNALCHIVPMALGISVYVSTLTSTAIAVDRYFVIVYPFKPRMKIWVCVLMIVAIWIISISISLPLGIYQDVQQFFDKQSGKFIYHCQETWPRPQARQFFTVTSLVLQYIVPCIIITYCYTKVSLALRRRQRMKIGSGSKSRERDEIEIRRKRRTNTMLIAMVTIFVLCWLPLNIVLLVTEYEAHFGQWYYFTLIFFCAHVIAMSSTMYNPFLYAWMNENFKKEFKMILPCLFISSDEANVNGQYTQYTQVETQPSMTVVNTPEREKNGNDNTKPTHNSNAYFESETEKVHLNLNEEIEHDEAC